MQCAAPPAGGPRLSPTAPGLCQLLTAPWPRPPRPPRCAELAEEAADLHNRLHAGGMGVDAPQPTDLYVRLAVDRCFYVGQLSGSSSAEVLPGGEYRGAEADPLRTRAAALVRNMNADRPEDIVRIRCGWRAGGPRAQQAHACRPWECFEARMSQAAAWCCAGLCLSAIHLMRPLSSTRPCASFPCSCHALGVAFEDMAWAEMVWVDRLGVHMRAARQDGSAAQDLRVPFVRPVEDEREARSALTMMAQVAWEAQR